MLLNFVSTRYQSQSGSLTNRATDWDIEQHSQENCLYNINCSQQILLTELLQVDGIVQLMEVIRWIHNFRIEIGSEAQRFLVLYWRLNDFWWDLQILGPVSQALVDNFCFIIPRNLVLSETYINYYLSGCFIKPMQRNCQRLMLAQYDFYPVLWMSSEETCLRVGNCWESVLPALILVAIFKMKLTNVPSVLKVSVR